MRILLGAMILAVSIATQADSLLAQRRGDFEPRRRAAVAVLLGGSSYDFVETGTGLTGALRFEIPSGRWMVIEPGLSVFSYETSVGDRLSYLLPEISFQFQPVSGAVRPYVGVGAGFTEYLSGRGATFATLHAAAGLRARINETWGLRGDVRLRSVDPFARSMFDWMVGVTRAIGN